MQDAEQNRPGPSATERRFHMLMAGLLVTSLFLDQWLEQGIYHPPRISMVTLAVLCVWGFVFAQRLLQARDLRGRVMQDRIERLEHKLDLLERELAQRRVPPLT